MLVSQRDDFAPKLRIFETIAKDVEEMGVLAGNAPCRAHGIVIAGSNRHRRVPTLDCPGRIAGRRRVVVGSEPRPSNQIALEGDRLLLVLGGKEKATDFHPDGLQSRAALARWMENIASSAPMRSAFPKRNIQLLVSDCRQIEMVPAALSKQIASKIVFVEPLHNGDDRAGLFVVETRNQGAAIPVDHPLSCLLGINLVGVEGIVDNDQIRAASGEGAAD